MSETSTELDRPVVTDLDNLELFKDLTAEQLSDIVNFCNRLQLHDGDILIHENEDEHFDLFVLCEGSVEVVSNNSAHVSGEAVLSHEHKDLFGEISWLTGRKRTATVRCHGEVEAICINGRRLWNYLEQNPTVGFYVMQRVASLMAHRLEETDSLLKQILWNTGI